jgi:CheY-specific phosphatase CheX
MSAELTSELLAQSLAQALEEAAFVFAEPTEEPPELQGQVIEARLGYAGPHEGELALAADAGFAATLAANLLGEDEGGAEAAGDDQDAVGELLNMIAGALVVELFGADVPCRLGLPRVARLTAAEHAATLGAAAAAASLLSEEGSRIDLSARLLRGAGA